MKVSTVSMMVNEWPDERKGWGGEGDNEMKKSGWVGLDLDLFMTELGPMGSTFRVQCHGCVC
jgi:hypothetical protein